MVQNTMTGSRAIIKVDGETVGIFDSCQYGAAIGTEAIHTLGRHSANEIAITSYEAVQVSCSGFRVIGQGVHTLPNAPKLSDLLKFTRVQITIEDRQTGALIMKVTECVPNNWSESQQAKGATRLNISYLGLVLSDEDGDQGEAEAVTLPLTTT